MQKFWKLIADELLPTLKARDSKGTELAYARLKGAYTAHRAIIDEIVESANKQNARIEELASQRDSSISYVLWSVSAVVLALIIVTTVFTVLRIISKLGITRKATADDFVAIVAWALDVGLSVTIMVGTKFGLGAPDSGG